MQLPSKSEVGYLDEEVAGEGQKIVLSDGEVVTWDTDPPKANFPDMTKIKSIKQYFARRPHRAYPAWLYHPTEKDRLVKNAEEAATLGVSYRPANQNEGAKYGVTHVWDFTEGSWRNQPYKGPHFDASNPGHGKNLIVGTPNPMHAQHELVAAVAAAVAREMQGKGPSAPATVDPAQWSEFIKFQAWQKAQQAVDEISADAEVDAVANMSNDDLLTELSKIAREKGIKVKKTWSIDDIKAALDQAA